MVSKKQITRITSLHQKKYRNKYGVFVAEGVKAVTEYLDANFVLDTLFTTTVDLFSVDKNRIYEVDDVLLNKLSFLKTPNKVVAIFEIPKYNFIEPNELTVVLDTINDPGNMGTIIRLCDWFGVKQIICSLETVDCYHPKVVQAAMGSLTRVAVFYTDLKQFLTTTTLPVFATTMSGTSVYNKKLPEKAILLMGNEANGISEELMALANQQISIPRFGTAAKPESLNVATATAIFLNECRRKFIQK